MASVTSGVGLCLDIVGAAVLVVVLWKRLAVLTTGDARTAREFAHDLAVGVSGALLLTFGFLFQLASALGYPHRESRRNCHLRVLASLLLGALVAGCIYFAVRPVAEAWETWRRASRTVAVS